MQRTEKVALNVFTIDEGRASVVWKQIVTFNCILIVVSARVTLNQDNAVLLFQTAHGAV